MTFLIRIVAYVLCWAGAAWAAIALIALEPSDMPGHLRFVKALVGFIIPGGSALLLGYFMFRWSNRRSKQDQQCHGQEPDRKREEEQRLLADFYKDKGKRYKSGFPLPGTDVRSETSKTPKVSAMTSSIAEGVCRSCGARKTLRDGMSVECDYCGSVISVN
ncbi:hypothetical protein [Saccharibacillus endophyticus]|uniref:hypothetical protein n=1 Tax=Saccharibacillus endophyticus TaxID=2060666 RepID=UPI001555CB9D|nr:hypothetical protein [Saccharibacillus endophyticus]